MKMREDIGILTMPERNVFQVFVKRKKERKSRKKPMIQASSILMEFNFERKQITPLAIARNK